MSITLHLAPDVEQRLREKAARGGQSVEEYILRLTGGVLPTESSPGPLTTEEWLAEFKTWVASHANWPTDIDDSRESIYGGRGE